MLPPESLPKPNGAPPAATTAAVPDDDPPGARVTSCGFLVTPNEALSAIARVTASITPPAARSRATAVASADGRRLMSPGSSPAAPDTGHPATSIQSFTVKGTPSNARPSPDARRRSAAIASANVRSRSTAATAPITGSNASSRSSNCSATSTAQQRRARSASATPTTVHDIRQILALQPTSEARTVAAARRPSAAPGNPAGTLPTTRTARTRRSTRHRAPPRRRAEPGRPSATPGVCSTRQPTRPEPDSPALTPRVAGAGTPKRPRPGSGDLLTNNARNTVHETDPSTSVPGLHAKPIIDVALVVPDGTVGISV